MDGNGGTKITTLLLQFGVRSNTIILLFKVTFYAKVSLVIVQMVCLTYSEMCGKDYGEPPVDGCFDVVFYTSPDRAIINGFA